MTQTSTTRLPSLSTFKSRWMGGAAAFALFAAAGAGFSGHAFSADVFGPSGSARAPQSAPAIPGFTDLVSAVKPAVVSVRVRAEAPTSPVSDQGNPFEGTPFERFFKEFGGPNGNRGNAQPRQMVGLGSGFFISPDGYIVTNNHVVNNAVKVEVVTDQGTVLEAKVIGTDPKTDLALIKVEGRNDFPFVKLASAKPAIGEWVVAMGNPFGLGGTVTAGIVSAQGRDIGSGPYDDFIQIDAPVNRGNSGGPTFNLKGEVVGVNTAIYSPSGGSIGIAFDIPSSTVASVIPQLQKSGHVDRGWLGVQIQPVTREIADSLGLNNAAGALIAGVQSNSPAAKAGLKAGDVITSIDGNEVKDAKDLSRKIGTLAPQRAVALQLMRDGKTQTVNLTLGQLAEQSAPKAGPQERPRHQRMGSLGLTLAPAAAVEGAGNNGLAVLNVDPSSKAAELGLQEGDIILKAGNKDLSGPDDLTAAFSEARAAGRKSTLALVKHGETDRYVAIPAG
ncbi:MAG: Do family serine endopeptidase [Hyphomicrobiales bacterium]|nr:MAG: Do family serine endopeptidase [Hyphomicrobiales bacterium]